MYLDTDTQRYFSKKKYLDTDTRYSILYLDTFFKKILSENESNRAQFFKNIKIAM